MITDTGRSQHLKIISGQAVRFADRFVVGSSNAALGPEANELDFGWGECMVKDSYVDEDRKQVVFYGTLPAEYAGQISEIGLATMNSDFIQTGRNINLSYYFSELESWNYSAEEKMDYTTESSLMGTDDIIVTDAAAGETLSKYLADDITLHTNVKMRISATQASQMEFRIYSGETDYVSKTFNLTSGENIVKFTIASMTATGNFDPSKAVMMEYRIITTGNYTFDAVVFTGENNSGLVTRSPVSVPKRKVMGNTMELEYAVMLGV